MQLVLIHVIFLNKKPITTISFIFSFFSFNFSLLDSEGKYMRIRIKERNVRGSGSRALVATCIFHNFPCTSMYRYSKGLGSKTEFVGLLSDRCCVSGYRLYKILYL